MPIEVEAPDGSVVEFPDGTSDEVMAQAMHRTFGGPLPIDFSRPREEVRAAIAKLPYPEQKRAHDRWADERVRRIYAGSGFTPHSSLARGIPIVGSLLDEASAGIQGALHGLTGRGQTYDEALAEARAYERAAAAVNPAETAAGHLLGGIATGGPLLSRLTPAATLMGRIGQGTVLGAGLGAAEGFGSGEGSFGDRLGQAGSGAKTGAVIGTALPVAGAALTRGVGAARDYIGPTVTRLIRGPEEAADAILANRIAREGSSPAAKRLDLQRGQAEAARLDSNSYATLPETIADTSDAMRRLTGSIYRQGGEAGNYVRDVLTRRQRGPENPFAPRDPNAPPEGQMARVMDATERALLIRSANTAHRTERQIMAEQAREGRRLYEQAKQKQEPFDIQGVLDALALQAQQYPGPFRARLLRALGLFRDDSPQRMAVNTIERFDAAKKALDDMIETAQRQGQGNMVRELTGFKNALLERVHLPDANGNPTINKAYWEARQAWGTAAANREAIELGRQALREGSEVSVEQYRDLTRGQQQLFRIGFLESLRNALGTRRPGNDITQLFQQQRVRDLLSAIIPRSKDAGGVFANRPERFGDLLNREQRMVQTANEVLGNSKTAQRQVDDMAFAGDALASMWNRFRGSPSLFNMGIEAIGVGIQKVFGYRQDVALAMARRLLETDPAVRNQILRRLARRGGPDRFARFADYLDRSINTLIGASPAALQLTDERSGTR